MDGISDETLARIGTQVADARKRIDAARRRAGRDDEVLLVAVSKTVDLPEVERAIEAGVHDFGENRTSELVRKAAAFPEQNWHFIGRIQTNKLKDVVGTACLIHSVASRHALEHIQKHASRLGIVQPVLLEVNVSGEESKDGFAPDGLLDALRFSEQLDAVEVRGLMTMAPLGSPEVARGVFANLRELRDTYKVYFEKSGNVHLEHLSMGMTQDFEEAVEEGATIVRLGRSVFA